jgi:hypothetical protein
MAEHPQNVADFLHQADPYVIPVVNFISPGLTFGFILLLLTLSGTVEQPKFPTSIVLLVYIVVMTWYGKIPMSISLLKKIWAPILILFAYLAVGLIWVPFKWWAYVRRPEVQLLLAGYGDDVSQDVLYKFITERYDIIYQWVLYWPFSMVITIFNRFIYHAIVEIIYRISDVLVSIMRTQITRLNAAKAVK